VSAQAPELPVVDLAEFTVVFANMHYGGIDLQTGDDGSWRETIAALAPFEPDVVSLQEMDAHNVFYLWRHMRRTANALGMEPVHGPSAALRAETDNHTGILVRTRPGGLQILNQSPPSGVAGPCVPPALVGGRIGQWSLEDASSLP
jgi:hypothetical protein